MTNELRAKFEAWARDVGFKEFAKRSDGEYATFISRTMFDACQFGHASRDAEVEALKRDVERYRELEKRAHKATAYDKYGNGAHWTIGLFSSDSRMTFSETIDAAMRNND